jgi:hypothetical protein
VLICDGAIIQALSVKLAEVLSLGMIFEMNGIEKVPRFEYEASRFSQGPIW